MLKLNTISVYLEIRLIAWRVRRQKAECFAFYKLEKKALKSALVVAENFGRIYID